MDSKQNPEGAMSNRIETTDDVEAHVASNRVNPDETGNDVAGHGAMSNRVNPDETGNDVDGHGMRGNRVADTDEDDVEGHGMRGNR